MTNILKKIREESAGRMSAMAALAIIILVSISSLTFVTRWTSAFVSQPYQQDNSPLVVFGNASGSVSDLNAFDGATWNLTAYDIELGLKTVEFFIGQDNSTGIASATTKNWPASVYLPEESITVDSAIVEISMKPSAADITSGSVSIDGRNSTAIPLIQTTAEMARMLYRYNATEALSNFTKGTNSFTLRVAMTGPVIYQENAKLILTYRYDRNSEVQLRTVRIFAGSDGTSKPAGSDTTSRFRLNIPETSPSVKSAWIENTASVPGAGVLSTYALSMNDDYHLSGLTLADTGGTHTIFLLYNATPFYALGSGWSQEYALKVRADTGGSPLDLWGAEAVMTYAYNATATTRTAHKTVSYLAGANTSIITAGSVTNFTFNIRIPEDEPVVESAWFRIAGETGAADNTFTVNVNGTWAQAFLYDWIGETDGTTPILANGTNALHGLRAGNNNLTLSIANSASSTSVLSAEAVITYNYSARSRTQQESVQYRVYQSYSEPNTANIVKSGNFSVKMPATSINVTSAYLQADPIISNTGTSLTGATSTGYGTWLNGSGSSFSVVTTDENLNVRTLMNATNVYGSEAIIAGRDSSWGANLLVVDENNYAHSAKFILTYTYDRKSRVEVLHNSTTGAHQSPIESVNATLRFMSKTTAWWNLTIYDWLQQQWSGCNATQVYANSWNVWHCNITTSLGYTPSSYVSADKIIKINMNSTNLTLTGELLEDYVRFDLTTDTPPKWDGPSTSIVATYSPTELSHLNMSWSDDLGISTAFVESNYSGAPANYTMSHAGGGNYTFNATIPAGTFYWRSYANDTVNQWNASSEVGFTVGKADNKLHMNLNGNLDDNRTITYGSQSNAAATSDAGQVAVMYFNGTANTNPHVAILGAARYNYTAYSAGNANYTSNSTIYFLTVQKAPSQAVTTYINSAMPGQDSTIIYGTQTNVTATTPYLASLGIYRNGTLVSSASGTSIIYFAPLGAGFYNFTVVSEANDNITSASSATRFQYIYLAPFGIVFSSDTGYGFGGSINVVFSSGTEYKSGENITQVVFLTFANGTYIPGATCFLDIYNITFSDKVITNASMTEVPSTGLYWYKNNSITAEGVYTSWVNCTYEGSSAYASRTFHIAPWANTITTIDTRTTQIQNTVGSGNGAVTIWNITQEINRTTTEMNRTIHQINDSIKATVVPKIDLALGNLTEIRALSLEINNTIWHIDLFHLGSYSLSTVTDEIRLNRDQITSLRTKLDKEAEFSKESVFLVTDSVNSVNSALQQIEAGNIATARLSLDTAAKSMAKAAEVYELESAIATVAKRPVGDSKTPITATIATGLTGSYSFFMSKIQVVRILAYIIMSAFLGAAIFRRMKPPGKGKSREKRKSAKYALGYILPYIFPSHWREVGGSIGLGLSGRQNSKNSKQKSGKTKRSKGRSG